MSDFQDQNMPDYIQGENRQSLLGGGWDPNKKSLETPQGMNYANIATRKRLSKTESIFFHNKDPQNQAIEDREVSQR